MLPTRASDTKEKSKCLRQKFGGVVVEALRWIMELGISNEEIESDSMLTVQAVNKGLVNFLEVGNLIDESRLQISALLRRACEFFIKEKKGREEKE